MNRFEGRRVLVTGGSRGIGAAVVRRLAAEGAVVAVHYRSAADAAEQLVAEVGGGAFTVAGDMADPAAIGRLVDTAAERLGGLDVLVSNAGIEHFGALAEITPEDFDRVYHVNVRGQLLVTQAAVRHMPKGGRIVLTSSVSATRAVYRHSLYAPSKAAVSSMVLQLSLELADQGITINAIAPGGTETDMAAEASSGYVNPRLDVPMADYFRAQVALGRLARPAEIAAAVAYLASDDASYVTGRTMAVDGGYL